MNTNVSTESIAPLDHLPLAYLFGAILNIESDLTDDQLARIRDTLEAVRAEMTTIH